MDFGTITPDQVALAFLSCVFIRMAMIYVLPDHIAGPGGWLVDTGEESV
jgi:hypothetical protein